MHFDLQNILITLMVIILAITFHEFAHAITADRLGDPTPRREGRISILPMDHLDPLGTIMMIVTTVTGVGIGWGKPVQTNPNNFRNPRVGGAIVAAAGPISNLIQAFLFSLLIRWVVQHPDAANESITDFVKLGLYINLGLAFFNLIPLGPLDGHWILSAMLPYEASRTYERWMMSYGQMALILLVVAVPGVLGAIIGPPTDYVAQLMLH